MPTLAGYLGEGKAIFYLAGDNCVTGRAGVFRQAIPIESRFGKFPAVHVALALVNLPAPFGILPRRRADENVASGESLRHLPELGLYFRFGLREEVEHVVILTTHMSPQPSGSERGCCHAGKDTLGLTLALPG